MRNPCCAKSLWWCFTTAAFPIQFSVGIEQFFVLRRACDFGGYDLTSRDEIAHEPFLDFDVAFVLGQIAQVVPWPARARLPDRGAMSAAVPGTRCSDGVRDSRIGAAQPDTVRARRCKPSRSGFRARGSGCPHRQDARAERNRPAISVSSGASAASGLSGPVRRSSAEVTFASDQPEPRLLQYARDETAARGDALAQLRGSINSRIDLSAEALHQRMQCGHHVGIGDRI
jgi:hypothetical protein